MGVYVNPPNESKEDFLKREAVKISREEFLMLSYNFSNKVGLCLVENPAFSACVVAESKEDAARYADKDDKRPKRYFLIERSKIAGMIE